MPTLLYNPSIRIAVSTRTHGIIDVSDDIESGNLNLHENNPHSLSFTLSNMNAKYANIFTPNDRVIVQMKRINWLQTFAGYLNSVPYFSVYPGSVTLTATCTMKRILQHYWSQDYEPNILKVQSFLGNKNLGNGLPDVIKGILTDIVGWDADKIHIGALPVNWTKNKYLREMWRDIELTETNIRALLDSGSGPGGTGGTGPSDGKTAGDFANGVLSDLNAPTTNNNVTKIINWMGHEEGHTTWALYGNPLNTTQTTGLKGQKLDILGTSSGGFPIYATMAVAAEATAATLLDPEPYYSDIVRNLRNNGSLADFSTYVVSSPWDAGHYGDNPSAMESPANGITTSSTDNGSPWVQQMKSSSNHLGTGTGGNAGSGTKDTTQAPGGTTAAQTAISICTAQPPIPYVCGGVGPPPNGFDCSGLVLYSWESAGFQGLPRTSQDMYESPYVAIIPLLQGNVLSLLPGDLLFAGNNADSQSVPNHMAMYVGSNTVAEAPHTGTNCRLVNLDTWLSENQVSPAADGGYGSYFMGAGRVLDAANAPTGNKAGANQFYSSGAGRVGVNISRLSKAKYVGSSGLEGDSTGVGIFTNALWQPGTNPGDPKAFYFTGLKLMLDDTPLMPYLSDLVTTSQRHFCSAPNGDFIAWFPDYFGVYGTGAVWHLSDIELNAFTVDWADDTLITHQYVSGSSARAVQSFDPRTGNPPTEDDWIISDGIATIDIPGILDVLANVTPGSPNTGLWENVGDIYKQFGARPDMQAMPIIGHGEVEFWFALSLFHQNWANMFTASVPMTWMPELWPGMLLALDKFGFQCYIQGVTHSWDTSNGGGFTTTAKVCAPSAIGNKSGLVGMARGGTV